MILLSLVLMACGTPDAGNLECVDVLQLTDVETADGDPVGAQAVPKRHGAQTQGS